MGVGLEERGLEKGVEAGRLLPLLFFPVENPMCPCRGDRGYFAYSLLRVFYSRGKEWREGKKVDW